MNNSQQSRCLEYKISAAALAHTGKAKGARKAKHACLHAGMLTKHSMASSACMRLNPCRPSLTGLAKRIQPLLSFLCNPTAALRQGYFLLVQPRYHLFCGFLCGSMAAFDPRRRYSASAAIPSDCTGYRQASQKEIHALQLQQSQPQGRLLANPLKCKMSHCLIWWLRTRRT